MIHYLIPTLFHFYIALRSVLIVYEHHAGQWHIATLHAVHVVGAARIAGVSIASAALSERVEEHVVVAALALIGHFRTAAAPCGEVETAVVDMPFLSTAALGQMVADAPPEWIAVVIGAPEVAYTEVQPRLQQPASAHRR